MTTNARRIVHTSRHALRAPPERVFPLLCPVREYDWIDGWSCRLVHTSSGVVEEGCVFVTEHPPEGTTVWYTSRHDPVARRLEFVRTSGDSHVSLMALAVAPDGAGGSTLEIAYTFTALGARGDALLGALGDGQALAARGARLARLLDHYLATGAMLREPAGHARG